MPGGGAATLTVTFGLPKVGLLVIGTGVCRGDHCGSDRPAPTLTDGRARYYTLNRMSSPLLPQRRAEAHKGTQGHLLVVGGSPGMTGAPVLAGLAGLRSGAGLVTLVVRDGLSLPEKPLELMVKPWSRLEWDAYDAIVVGPGLSTQADGKEILEMLLGRTRPCCLLDADALNLLAQIPQWWEKVKGALVLTPHPGEMARLCGLSTGEVQANRLGLVKEKAEQWGVTLVLKGAATLVGSGKEPIYINTTGNPALATGGTGDVLAGMIGGLLAQGLAPATAAVVGSIFMGKPETWRLRRLARPGSWRGNCCRGFHG